MRNVLIFACLILLMATSLMAAMPPDKTRVSMGQQASLDTDSWIDANQILMMVTNMGSFAYDNGVTLGKSDGLYFPFVGIDETSGDPIDPKTLIFAAGIWVGAVDNATGDTLISVAEYSNDYWPGPMVGGSFVGNADIDPKYRVYKLYSDSTGDDANADYINWPVDQGAPVDSNGNPEIIGDQMLWAVYNDANPSPHTNDASSPVGLGVEIKQTTFAFAREGALANIVFVKFQIYNKGGKDLSNMFVSLWADPDLGGAGDDFVASDTTLSLGYCYNDGEDSDYGSKPPAVGFDFFQGPLEVTGDMADTAIMWGTTFPGQRNMAMTSFNKYINGTDPGTATESYWYMNGLSDQVFGQPMVDPNTGDTTTFFGAGDPVSGTGWIDVNSSDRRYMLSVGPFDFAPGDSTEVVAAIVVGQGADELRSITVLKTIDAFAQRVYDRGFQLPDPPAKPDITPVAFDEEIVLRWGTASEDDPGDFPFEGYALFQGPSPAGPWIDTLGWFDEVNDIGGIIDFRFDLITGQELPYVAKPGTNGGVEHFYRTSRNALTGGSLINNTEYFFRCEAYSYDPAQPSGEKTLTSASIVSIFPTLPLVGTTLEVDIATDIPTTHSSGIGEGTVEVMVVDPTAVTGDAYSVTFSEDTVITTVIDTANWTFEWNDTANATICGVEWIDSLQIVDTIFCRDTFLIDSTFHPEKTTVDSTVSVFWNLTNTTKDTVLLTRMFNQGKQGEENYPVVDGIQAIVRGPDPAFKSFQVVANGSGALDPPESGAFDFGDFPTPPGSDAVSGRPSANQQVGAGKWGFHTADNGGTCNGGTRGGFDAFIARGTRDEGNFPVIASFDYEMRFTGDTTAGVYDSALGGGSIAVNAFTDESLMWVPFELWRTGVGTPNDASDDVRLTVWTIDNGDLTYNLENWGCGADTLRSNGSGEHSVSGADNDPWTDWVYWLLPPDASAGDAGYQADAAAMLAATYDYGGTEVMARTVLVNWNGHLAASDIDTALGDTLTVPAVFNQDLPEPGTIFRLITSKPSSPSDVFTFTTAGLEASIATAGSESLLDNVKAVPNPYYLFSDYDVSNVLRKLKFTNLPQKCTIRIFNLGGDMVQKIEKDDASTETFWDIENSSGVPVGSGIYIYVVEAPGFGQKIGKMAIFTEVELLNQY